ncbi:hypothetical protein BRAS3843_2470024 [Bradyrhizobium sp. STM 3843]|nr:hypothetical protein BRAS3843_2470024 [Bradyrhizobium sp. STM 3843]
MAQKSAARCEADKVSTGTHGLFGLPSKRLAGEQVGVVKSLEGLSLRTAPCFTHEILIL